MIHGLLRLVGWWMNYKRVERIWCQEGLKVPKKQPKRGRLWLNDGSCVRLRAERKDHVWSYGFVQASTRDGRSLRMLTLIDEFTRECLAIDVARKLNHDDVLERLAWRMTARHIPGCHQAPDYLLKGVSPAATGCLKVSCRCEIVILLTARLGGLARDHTVKYRFHGTRKGPTEELLFAHRASRRSGYRANI